MIQTGRSQGPGVLRGLLAGCGLFLAFQLPALPSLTRSAHADDAATHYNMGLQLKRQGKLAEAINEVEKAIELRSDYAAAHFTLGNLWRAQGDLPKAAKSLERAVELQPQDAAARSNLG